MSRDEDDTVGSRENAEIDLAKLAEPFESQCVEWRIGQAGRSGQKIWAKVLAYITARAVHDRLDQVCGPENWRNEFREWSVGEEHGVLCGLSIRVRGEWISKWDGASNTDFEPIKGGLSDAEKRAAVQWGIGRYLYGLGESWAKVLGPERVDGAYFAFNAKIGPKNAPEFISFAWEPPPLPLWALPKPKGNEVPLSQQPPQKAAQEPKSQPTPFQAARGKIATTFNGRELDDLAKRVSASEKLTDDEKIELVAKYINPQRDKIAERDSRKSPQETNQY